MAVAATLGAAEPEKHEKATKEHEKHDVVTKAIAVLHPLGNSKVAGVIVFTQHGDVVEVRGEVTGLTPGLHGFHIHEFGDGSSPDGNSAGPHFNPGGHKHGGPETAERHAGDLGNIEADEGGKGAVSLKDRHLKLSGPHSIIGRSVIVHADPDDLKSQPAGNAGARIAYGVIGIANPKPPAAKPATK